MRFTTFKNNLRRGESFGGRSITFTEVDSPFPDSGVEEPGDPGFPGETTFLALDLQ